MGRLGRTYLPEPAKLDWEIIRSLIPFLGAYRGRAALAGALLIVAKMATVTVPLILKELVDALDPNGGVLVVVPVGLLLAYGGLRLATSFFGELQSTVFARVRFGIMRRISLQVVGHLHDLSLRFHLDRKTGEVARDIGRGTSSVSTLLNYLLFNIVPTLMEVGMVCAILVIQYDPRFAAVALVTVVIYVGFTFAVTAWRMRFRAETNRLDSEATSRAIDGLLNYETVKYFGNEGYEIERYDESLSAWEDVGIKSQASLSFLNFGQGLLIAIGVTATMFLAAGGVVDGRLSIGDFVAVNAFLLQLFMPLGFLGTIYSMLKHALSDMERMFLLLEKVPEVQDAANATPLQVNGGRLHFADVHFAYDPDREILHGVDIDVPAGSKVAVVGASGAGKSTLGRLLYRFYDVTDGAVTIDEQDVRQVTQASLREAIGIVPQDTVLFNDTIGFNIRYGRLDASEDEVHAAARLARLDAFVDSLPKGYDTLVGERGLKLSGGEKQRVAIARAVLKNPPILIFDEATSSLDSESEAAILDALRSLAGERTTLTIAHRLSTIVDCDEIVVIDEGRVIERGPHQNLLAAAGQYARLWDMQKRERAEPEG